MELKNLVVLASWVLLFVIFYAGRVLGKGLEALREELRNASKETGQQLKTIQRELGVIQRELEDAKQEVEEISSSLGPPRRLSYPDASDHAPIPAGHVSIKAPNRGLFYRSPNLGAKPYVEVGQQIEADTEVCLIEVMRLFTPLKGGVKGIVHEIRARNGQMVEFDEVLMVVEPA
jgi:biotin carboxyl carrier protein